MYDKPIEEHTNLPHDLNYHLENGVPVLDKAEDID